MNSLSLDKLYEALDFKSGGLYPVMGAPSFKTGDERKPGTVRGNVGMFSKHLTALTFFYIFFFSF